MPQSGRVVFSKMDEVQLGKPAAEARRGAGRARPRHAAQLGGGEVGAEHFERIAAQAMGTPWVPRNPRPIAGPAEVREILELAA